MIIATLSPRQRATRAFLSLLTPEQVHGLIHALATNDPRLTQGVTTSPPAIPACADWPCEGCCPIGYTGLLDGLVTVGEIEDFFARTCYAIDGILGEPAGCRWFLNHWDEAPRTEAFAELLAEVREWQANRRVA